MIVVCNMHACMIRYIMDTCHYYKNDFAQRSTFALRGGLLFLPAAVNPTIYRGGHFLFTVASIFARRGKSIYRGGRPP